MLTPIKHYLFRLLFLSIGLLSLPISHADVSIKVYDVAIILNQKNATHQTVQQALTNRLQQEQNTQYHITLIDYPHQPVQAISKDHDLIVSIGSRASEWSIKQNTHIPLLSIMISSEKYRAIASRFPNQVSAIVIDQPIARYYQLIKASLPHIQHVNTIFGPHSNSRKQEMFEQATRYDIKLHAYTLSDHDTVLDGLNRIMTKYNSVLLTLPDPRVINRRSIRSVLLHAYHKNTPVFGFSRNYVRAGAIAAIFTTPTQFGLEAADRIIHHAGHNQASDPAMQYPERYEIEINKRVIQSMNLIFPPLSEIWKRMGARP